MQEPSAHILIVEDSRAQRALIAEILRNEGHRVTEAKDGLEGEILARAQRFDLVLTDFEMPNLNGIELCRRLRERHEYKTVPIVIMSARSDLDTRVSGLTTGANDYLAKPLAQREVTARVRSLLALGRAQAELEQRNRELAGALVELERCQDRLIASEKLAFAGRMAGGVLHEANSPLQALTLNFAALGDFCQQLIDAIPAADKADGDLAMTCEDVPRIITSCTDAITRLARAVEGFRQLEGISYANPGEHDADLRDTIERAGKSAGVEASLPAAPLPMMLGHKDVEAHVSTLLAHVRDVHGKVALRLFDDRRVEISAPLAATAVDLLVPDFVTPEGRVRFDMSASAAREALVRMGASVQIRPGTLAIRFPARQE